MGQYYLIRVACCVVAVYILCLSHNLLSNFGPRRYSSPQRTLSKDTLIEKANISVGNFFVYSDFYKKCIDGESKGMNTNSYPLETDESLMDMFRFPWNFVKNVNRNNVDHFVFAMACSENHYNESRDAIASTQKFFPDRRILFYDWGLNPEQKMEVQGLCGVDCKPFNFSEFPAAASLRGRPLYQAHKIFVIMDAMADNDAVFWIDTSVRFMSNNLTSAYNKAIESDGIVYFSKTTHSTFAVTHPSTYNFIPTNLTAQKKLNQLATNAALYYKTRKIFDGVLWWWFLCALRKDCISPTTEMICDFGLRDRMLEYAGCHRVDQSVANLLVSNLYGFEIERCLASLREDGVFKIKRHPTHYYQLRQCSESEKFSIGTEAT
ncbi:hypothetical protein CAPTEDRAFT_204101 [Capitella teleta]|uniref:Nucleotide-diphospho-sugar transferase domain-containing protein n=1 Tax=Capitella teleta TaxID=283909 RepID=R7ULT3_CAPTE|nr:hypothetical protein CAPTEDRAFT_204101 [Capitella teleta]|eukprot:ELU07489.1 hypothetical protein CAPTEDRAFT_204101 [Capitella teleta]